MTLVVPTRFLMDVSSSKTQIFPKVQIHTESLLGFDLYFSTKKLDFDGFFYKPLLLKIPTIKEKFDIETKKFVVSKLNLEFSNAKFEDGRMSDILGQTGLVNVDVTLSYQSQSAQTQSDCLEVFKGKIRRVKHDSEKLVLEVHDPGSFHHKDLPQTYLDNLVGPSQGKPIPINYGEQEYQPTVVQRGAGGGYLVHFDTCPHLGERDIWMETSLKLTDTQQYTGSIYGEIGFYPYYRSSSYHPIMIFVNGKYGGVRDATYGAFGDHEHNGNIRGFPNDHPFNVKGHNKKQTNATGVSAAWGGTDINYATDTYYRIYNTYFLANHDVLVCLWGHKPDDFTVERQSGNADLELEEWRPDNFGETLVKNSIDGNYLHSIWTESVVNDYTTPSDANTAEDFAVSGGIDTETDFMFFRVPLARVSFSTDPGTDWDRMVLQYIYIGGLVMPRSNDSTGRTNGVFMEWNDVSRPPNPATEEAYRYYYPSAYEATGAWSDDEFKDKIDGATSYYDNDHYRTGGSIVLNPDKGHPGVNVTVPGSNAGYVRECFAFAGWQPRDAHSGIYYSGDIQEASSQRANSQYIQPAFEFQTQNIAGAISPGWARYWLSTVYTGEAVFEFEHEFTHANQLGQTVTNSSLQPQIRQLDILTYTHQKNPMQHPFVVNNRGRVHSSATNPGHIGSWSENRHLQNPADIIRHILEFELGFYTFDESDYLEAYNQHSGWNYCCSVNEKISSKALIEDLAKSTKMFPKFGVDGNFKFNTIKDSYDVAEYDTAFPIDIKEIIKFNFSLTKIEDVCARVEVFYRWDFHNGAYAKNLDDVCQYNSALTYYDSSAGYIKAYAAHPAPPQGMQVVDHRYTLGDSNDNPIMTDEQLAYYNFTDVDNHVLKHETKYISEWEQSHALWGDWNLRTAQKLRMFLFNQFRNQHLLFTLRLPLKYINLDVGDIIKMEHLISREMGAYGINYTRLDNLNGQYRYPLFFITGVNKSINYIEITAFQLHFLGEDADFPGLEGWQAVEGDEYEEATVAPTFSNTGVADLVMPGCTDPDASNYQSWANIDDGSCVYPNYGCTDPNAENYDPDADTDDGTCEYILGCTNPAAINFNVNATQDDGSCQLEYSDNDFLFFSGIYGWSGDTLWMMTTKKEFMLGDFTESGIVTDAPMFTEIYLNDFFIQQNTFAISLADFTLLGEGNQGEYGSGFDWLFGPHRWSKGLAWTSMVGVDNYIDLFTRPPVPSEVEDGFVMMSITIGPDEEMWNQSDNMVTMSGYDESTGVTWTNQVVPGFWYGVYRFELKVFYTNPDNNDDPGAYAEWSLVEEEPWNDTIGTYYQNIPAGPNAGPSTQTAFYGVPEDSYPIIVDKNLRGGVVGAGFFYGSEGWEDLTYMATKITIDIPFTLFIDPYSSEVYSSYANDAMIVWNTKLPKDFASSNINYEVWEDPDISIDGGPGDFNFDGNVNVLDVVGMVAVILGNAEASNEQYINMDINQDGVSNILDVVILVNQILGNT